jgi:hypothetical protein
VLTKAQRPSGRNIGQGSLGKERVALELLRDVFFSVPRPAELGAMLTL